MTSELQWSVKTLDEMSALEWHRCMQLRCEVFVVEQNCPYQEADHKDEQSLHIYANTPDGSVVAYARAPLPGVSYPEVAIGRVVTSPALRGQGMGNVLMDKTLEAIAQRLGEVPIRISAQAYLERFYAGYGFASVGEPYLEDDIPHIEMLRP